MSRIHHIEIDPALNGYVCRVGCQTIVFESTSALLGTLGRYLENPQGIEAEFLKKAVNPMIPQPAPICNEALRAPHNDRPETVGAFTVTATAQEQAR